MTIDEIRTRVNESPVRDQFESFELNLNWSYINFSISLKGLVAVAQFVSTQAAGWSKLQGDLPDVLSKSKAQFDETKKQIQGLLGETNSFTVSNIWNEIKRQLETEGRRYFPYEVPEVDFLIKVYHEFPDYFNGAYKFIINDIRNANSRNDMMGMIFAYEFILKDNTKILERRNAEKASIGKIRNDFMNYLNESEEQISEYIRKTDEQYSQYTTQIDQLKLEKEKLFKEWFETSKNSFDTFNQDANKKIEDLEKAYEALLSLKKPADYWNKRATLLKAEGQVFLRWLVGLVLFGCLTLYLLLWLTPEGMLLSFIKGQASAIKWSIVYVTFISLLAFGIKAVSKAMFSSFHLARDAEEREQLTYVYLAMIKEGAADEKDKSLIMQSLFSRSDTGLLKEDSGPTMPGNIAEKVIQR